MAANVSEEHIPSVFRVKIIIFEQQILLQQKNTSRMRVADYAIPNRLHDSSLLIVVSDCYVRTRKVKFGMWLINDIRWKR